MLKDKLLKLKDEKYKEFNIKLIPNILPENSIGIRIPILRKFAKKLNNKDIQQFLESTPHKYLEENNLHILLINEMKDINKAVNSLESFLMYIDNWQTSDLLSPKIFKKYPDLIYSKITFWINSKKEYHVRVAIKLLISFYLDDNYNKKILGLVSSIKSQKYYVNMAISWFFSFAIIKHFNDSIIYLENNKFDKFNHNMTIQKCLDSKRLSQEKKDILKELKIK